MVGNSNEWGGCLRQGQYRRSDHRECRRVAAVITDVGEDCRVRHLVGIVACVRRHKAEGDRLVGGDRARPGDLPILHAGVFRLPPWDPTGESYKRRQGVGHLRAVGISHAVVAQNYGVGHFAVVGHIRRGGGLLRNGQHGRLYDREGGTAITSTERIAEGRRVGHLFRIIARVVGYEGQGDSSACSNRARPGYQVSRSACPGGLSSRHPAGEDDVGWQTVRQDCPVRVPVAIVAQDDCVGDFSMIGNIRIRCNSLEKSQIRSDDRHGRMTPIVCCVCINQRGRDRCRVGKDRLSRESNPQQTADQDGAHLTWR